jgi:uncharacterized repeat protein (TIGR03803 family)
MQPFTRSVMMLILLTMLCGQAVLSSAQTVNTVHSFNGTDGQSPQVVVLREGRDGLLYGTTYFGGINGLGTIFKQRTLGTGNVVLYNFNGPDGSYPAGGLTLGTDGNYYGTTVGGGAYGFGVVFKVTSGGALTVLYSFTGGTDDGGYPLAPPIQASDGNYYGTTDGAGAGDATFYKMTPSGSLSTIYTSSTSSGWFVQSSLLQGTDGSLYSTATLGGAFNCGAILKLTTTGVLKARYSFPCGVGGLSPIGTVIQGTDGNLYGTTLNGGTYNNAGTVFKIDTTHGSFTTLYSFGATTGDGYGGYSGLTLGTDGNLYGGTAIGGKAGAGSLYKITTSGAYTQLYSFPNLVGTNGQEPVAALTQDTSGKFYGITQFGGTFGDGSVYTLDVGLGPFVTFVKSGGKIGLQAQILGHGLTGATSVTFNGILATSFNVAADSYMTAVIPAGATTGPVVVTTPSGMMTSNVNFSITR